MKSLIYIILFNFLSVSGGFASSKDAKADSLLTLIRNEKDNNARIKRLTVYGTEYRYIYPDSCIKYIDLYFKANKNVLTKENEALVTLLGDVYWHLGKPETSIKKYTEAYEFCKSINNKKGISQNLGNIGYIEMEQGNYPESLVHYKEALAIAQGAGDIEYVRIVGLYIAQLYDWMGEYDEAVKSYHEMRVHFENKKNHRSYGIMLINIGAVHGNKKSTDSALYYYDLALKFLPKEEEKSIAITKSNIAFVYMLKNTNYPKVRNTLDEVRPVFVKYNSQSNLTLVDYYDALYFIAMKDYPKAKSFLLKSLVQYKSENNISRLSNVYDRLATVYERLNKIDSAYYNFKLFKQFSDSVLIDLAQNNMSYQRVKFGMDKKQLEIQTLEQKQTIQKEQLKSEKTQRFAMYGGIVLLLVFGVFMFNRFRVTQKQKKIIEEQKELVEEKQKEVMDSIYYAKRIQKAHLPSDKYIAKKMKELKKK